MSGNMVLSFIQKMSGIKNPDVMLAIFITISILISSFVFFQISLLISKTMRAATPKQTDREVLEDIYKENGGETWLIEFSKNWMSREAWELWKAEITKNRNVTNPNGKWAGVEIDLIYGKEHVVDLQMRDNIHLTGNFPNLFSLTYLLSLDFDHCKLSGNIPKEIGFLQNLTYLNLSFNNLTGGIPEEIGNLTNLTFLNLNRNPLGGCIPSTIGNLKKLEHLWLANCRLSGNIPYDVGHLVELRDLVLCENKITGRIPHEIGVMTKLDRLILSMNDLSGLLPDSLCQCKALTLLYLDRNRFSGELPNEVTDLSNLRELWIYSTNITIGGKPLIRGVERALSKSMPHVDIVVEQPNSPTRVLVRKQKNSSSPNGK